MPRSRGGKQPARMGPVGDVKRMPQSLSAAAAPRSKASKVFSPSQKNSRNSTYKHFSTCDHLGKEKSPSSRS